jgi:hypothetical protein
MHPHRCQHAAFDGGPDDPRTLVYRYQQGLRRRLLVEARAEEDRLSWWSSGSLALIRWAFGRPDPIRVAQPAAS